MPFHIVSCLEVFMLQYVQKQGAIDPKEMEKRRWYLQEQREKLLKIKRDQREKELSKYEGKKQGTEL